MTSLTERLEEVERQEVIDDTAKLIDDEVARKSGISGMAIKTGYKVVKRLKPNMIEEAIDSLLDEFSQALDPLYQQFLADDETETFEAYLADHDDQAADDLLGITDARAENAENRVLKKTYKKLRGQAKKHVQEALPGVGRLIDEHAPKE